MVLAMCQRPITVRSTRTTACWQLPHFLLGTTLTITQRTHDCSMERMLALFQEVVDRVCLMIQHVHIVQCFKGSSARNLSERHAMSGICVASPFASARKQSKPTELKASWAGWFNVLNAVWPALLSFWLDGAPVSVIASQSFRVLNTPLRASNVHIDA